MPLGINSELGWNTSVRCLDASQSPSRLSTPVRLVASVAARSKRHYLLAHTNALTVDTSQTAMKTRPATSSLWASVRWGTSELTLGETAPLRSQRKRLTLQVLSLNQESHGFSRVECQIASSISRSGFSSRRMTSLQKRAASAPSTRRWSNDRLRYIMCATTMLSFSSTMGRLTML